MSNRPAPAVRIIFSTAALVALLTFSSCGDDEDAVTNVNVTLREFSVSLSQNSAPAGEIMFNVTNAGSDDHEFLVISTNLAPNALPVETNGSYEEDGPGTELLNEIELIPPGATAHLNVNLGSGKYVLICNMVHIEDGEVEAHYSLGMYTGFTVT